MASSAPEVRAYFRASLIKALALRVPSMSQQRSEHWANVVLQIVRGMMQMYNNANQRSPIPHELCMQTDALNNV